MGRLGLNLRPQSLDFEYPPRQEEEEEDEGTPFFTETFITQDNDQQ